MQITYENKLSRIFTPAGYLNFIKDRSNRDSIERVKILPPKLGSLSFGKIYVEFKYAPKNFFANT
jgi:hypothetical protein